MDYARHNEWVSALRRNALRFVLIVGTANLFADLTYEGARSVNGQFLATLGASAAVVGFTAGFGELLGYGLRSIAGLVADRTGRYWLAAIAGYIINMAAVPALALAGNWQLAAVLIITERTGRAIRKPAMATMLSHAGQRIGHGWVFGLNEALDQAGATIGPLMMALVLFLRGGYRQGYAVLVIPAVITVGTIVAARHFFPQPRDLEAGHPLEGRGLSRRYWLYLVAAGCIGAGFADFALIGYHFEKTHVVAQTLIPLYYAVAMGVGAIGALILGRLFDINQARTIFGAVIVAALFATVGLSRRIGRGASWNDPLGDRHGAYRIGPTVPCGRHRRAGTAGDRIRPLRHRIWRGVVRWQRPDGHSLSDLDPQPGHFLGARPAHGISFLCTRRFWPRRKGR